MSSPASLAFAVLVGISVPSLVFGRAVFAVTLGLALLALAISELRSESWHRFNKMARSPIGLGLAVVLAFWVVSALGSALPIRALEASLRTGLFVGVGALIFSALRANEELAQLSLKALIGFTIVGGTFALLATLLWPEIYWALRFKGWQPTKITTEFKGFSALVVVLLPVLVLGIFRLQKWWKIAALIGIAEMASIMWLASNRAAIAGLLGIGMICSVALLRRQGKWVKGVIAFASVCSVAALTIIWLHETRNFLSDFGPPGKEWLFPLWLVDFQRQTVWAFAIEIWQNAPWFGIGPNSINFSPGANAPLPGDSNLQLIPAHPHNWVIEILAETGVFGLGSLAIVVAMIMLGCLKRYLTHVDPAMLAALMVFTGYWVSSLFNFSYWSAWWQLSFFLMLAMVYALAKSPDGY